MILTLNVARQLVGELVQSPVSNNNLVPIYLRRREIVLKNVKKSTNILPTIVINIFLVFTSLKMCGNSKNDFLVEKSKTSSEI